MALLNVLRFPDPRLRNKANNVETFDDELVQLADNMLETMYEGRGVGLAATQVNISKRILVLDVSDNQNEPQVFVNPDIFHKEGHVKTAEGCLSVPGVYEYVSRAARIKLRAYNQYGEPIELETGDLLAICLQHETDHLDGKLFIDHLSALKRNRVIKRLKKMEKRTF